MLSCIFICASMPFEVEFKFNVQCCFLLPFLSLNECNRWFTPTGWRRTKEDMIMEVL